MVASVKNGREAVGGKVKVCDRHHGTNTEQSRYDITSSGSMDRNGNLGTG